VHLSFPKIAGPWQNDRRGFDNTWTPAWGSALATKMTRRRSQGTKTRYDLLPSSYRSSLLSQAIFPEPSTLRSTLLASPNYVDPAEAPLDFHGCRQPHPSCAVWSSGASRRSRRSNLHYRCGGQESRSEICKIYSLIFPWMGCQPQAHSSSSSRRVCSILYSHCYAYSEKNLVTIIIELFFFWKAFRILDTITTPWVLHISWK
jgi:hypothetical protein